MKAWLILFLAVASLLVFSINRITPKDIEEYEALTAASNQKREKATLPFFLSQFRDHVVKEVWYGQNAPGYVKIVSDGSELIALQKEGKYGATETLNNVNFSWNERGDITTTVTADNACFNEDKVTFTGNVKVTSKEYKINSSHASLDYAKEGGKFAVSKIVLWGNVEMHSLENGEQYALADSVECYPQEESLVLKALQNNRVLFFDKPKGITISADMVKAKRVNGKEVIEGIGNVRFTFLDEEFEKLKKKFEIK